MDKKTRLILSVIGVAAIAIPALLLIFVTSRDNSTPQVPTENRQIDAKNVEDAAGKRIPGESPTPLPTPTPQSATESAEPDEGTPSGDQ